MVNEGKCLKVRDIRLLIKASELTNVIEDRAIVLFGHYPITTSFLGPVSKMQR